MKFALHILFYFAFVLLMLTTFFYTKRHLRLLQHTVIALSATPLTFYEKLSRCNRQLIGTRGGEISKMYTCPRTTGCKKALVRTKALLARTQTNTKARFVNIMIL